MAAAGTSGAGSGGADGVRGVRSELHAASMPPGSLKRGTPFWVHLALEEESATAVGLQLADHRSLNALSAACQPNRKKTVDCTVSLR